jgi:predicted DCC family thiol-disulfide oxidoreductase YuxK
VKTIVPKDKQLILFDGVCNLCNSSVLFVIKRDKKDRFLFAPLQSDIGKAIIKKFNIDTEQTDSILLYNSTKDSLTYKSTAALLVAKQLRFPTNILAVFLVVPAFIRNWVYTFIAKNRYKWYGKKESCMIPTPELKAKFIA